MSWKPIDTAPKDGTRFIAYVPIKKHRMMICFFTKEGYLLEDNCMPPKWPVTQWHELPYMPD